MAFRIGCDLDGTLADIDGAFQREAERLFGRRLDLRTGSPTHFEPLADERISVPAPNPHQRAMTDREVRQLWSHVRGVENFWESLEEIEPGAVARLAALTALHRWELIFLTQRPPTAGDTAQVQSQRWLRARGFELPSVYVMTGCRGRVAASLGLDVVLDDRAENCLDVATQSKATSLLVWRDPPQLVPPGAARLGIETVFSAAEALERLREAMPRLAEPARPSTVLTQLRAAIGL